MKKVYVSPKIESLVFEMQDMITVSSGGTPVVKMTTLETSSEDWEEVIDIF